MSATVVIGGTRSGKSAHAEELAHISGLPVRYVATADGADPEMAERIRTHAQRRPAAWSTIQAGSRLADALTGADAACVLLDGIGAWIATQLHLAGAFDAGTDHDLLSRTSKQILREVDRAVQALAGAGAAIVVAEQAGDGVLPADAAARVWVDLLGEATQRFAADADRVDLVVAGRALTVGAPAVSEAPAALDSSLRRHGDRDVRPGDVDHAVNVMAGGPPSWLREALDRALAGDVSRYPSEDAALAAVAALHGRREQEVVPTNGGVEALWLIGPALRPALAACVYPAFTESEVALRAAGVPVVRVQRDSDHDFALDPAAVPEAADLVIVGNPASPSGTLDPAASILALRRRGRVVVVDEAFMELVPGEPGSLAREPLDDVIVVRSLTKALGIPGLRAGYALAAPAIADRLRAVRPAWSANALALAALTAAAGRPDAIAAIAERAATERDDLQRRLALIEGVRVWPGVANFCLIEVDDGARVVAALRDDAIAVRPAASFPGLSAGHIRVTARDADHNERLAHALRAALGVPA